MQKGWKYQWTMIQAVVTIDLQGRVHMSERKERERMRQYLWPKLMMWFVDAPVNKAPKRQKPGC